MPGTVWGVSYISYHNLYIKLLSQVLLIMLRLEVGKLRRREMKWLTQGPQPRGGRARIGTQPCGSQVYALPLCPGPCSSHRLFSPSSTSQNSGICPCLRTRGTHYKSLKESEISFKYQTPTQRGEGYSERDVLPGLL